MKISLKSLLLCAAMLGILSTYSTSRADELGDELLGDDAMEELSIVPDPLEPLNRVFFVFNDTLYFLAIKPASQVYEALLAEEIRTLISNAFRNILAPVRVVNNLLQGKAGDSGREVARFVLNTFLGVGGLGDPATEVFHITPKVEDFGQTLGRWGVGEGVYICWPLLGPSNLRDTVGFVGDAFLNPLSYLTLSDGDAAIAAQTTQKINATSLTLGEYEQFKESTFDPYTAMRDFYTQSRRSKIQDKVHHHDMAQEGAMAAVSFMSTNENWAGLKNVPHEQKNTVVHSFADLNNVLENGDSQWLLKQF